MRSSQIKLTAELERKASEEREKIRSSLDTYERECSKKRDELRQEVEQSRQAAEEEIRSNRQSTRLVLCFPSIFGTHVQMIDLMYFYPSLSSSLFSPLLLLNTRTSNSISNAKKVNARQCYEHNSLNDLKKFCVTFL